MSDTNKKADSQSTSPRADEATDKRTLDEIEEEERVSNDTPSAPPPSPDEGAGRRNDEDAGGPM